jgi:hypothetical protein
VGEALLSLDYLDKIIPLASIHTNAAPVSRTAAFLFGCLAFSTTNCESIVQLGSDGIMKFMVTMMSVYPNDVSVTYGACTYFEEMSRSPEVKVLLKHGIVVVQMAVIFQTFSHSDGALELKDETKSEVKIIIQQSQYALSLLIET